MIAMFLRVVNVVVLFVTIALTIPSTTTTTTITTTTTTVLPTGTFVTAFVAVAVVVVVRPKTSSTSPFVRFHPAEQRRRTVQQPSTTTALGYEPKWKKKETLAEQIGVSGNTVRDLKEIGIQGTIPVTFTQGNVTKTTMALPNQPLREVAIQAGQFIKYGCGKGECGTCEALVNGQWVRPCVINVPNDVRPGESYIVQVKAVKNKARSSGKFYSVRSFLYGFYNNVLGMIGMVTYKRNAKQNYIDRMDYEDLIRQRTMEKKRLKKAASLEISATGSSKQK